MRSKIEFEECLKDSPKFRSVFHFPPTINHPSSLSISSSSNKWPVAVINSPPS